MGEKSPWKPQKYPWSNLRLLFLCATASENTSPNKHSGALRALTAEGKPPADMFYCTLAPIKSSGSSGGHRGRRCGATLHLSASFEGWKWKSWLSCSCEWNVPRLSCKHGGCFTLCLSSWKQYFIQPNQHPLPPQNGRRCSAPKPGVRSIAAVLSPADTTQMWEGRLRRRITRKEWRGRESALTWPRAKNTNAFLFSQVSLPGL